MATSIYWNTSILPTNFKESNFKESEKQANIITSMDVGPSKIRRRYTTYVPIYSGTMFMTETQKNLFKYFYQTTTRNGQYSFMFLDPSGTGYIEVKFDGTPKYKALENSFWNVTFNLTQCDM